MQHATSPFRQQLGTWRHCHQGKGSPSQVTKGRRSAFMDLRLLLHTGKSLERCTVAFIKGISLPLQTILSLMHTGRKWNGSPGPWEATVVALYSRFGEGKSSPASLGLCCSPAKYFKFPMRSGGEMPALSFTQKPFGASQCLMPSKTRERLCTVRWQAEGSCISSSRCVSAIFIS